MSDRFLWCRLWCYLRPYSPLFASVRALRCRSIRLKQNPSQPSGWEGLNWVQGLDLNQRPSGYEPDELPGCSTLQCGELPTCEPVANLSTAFSQIVRRRAHLPIDGGASDWAGRPCAWRASTGKTKPSPEATAGRSPVPLCWPAERAPDATDNREMRLVAWSIGQGACPGRPI